MMNLNISLFIRRYILSVAFSADLESRLASSGASAHPIIHEGLLTSPRESSVIGNGDLEVSWQIFSQ